MPIYRNTDNKTPTDKSTPEIRSSPDALAARVVRLNSQGVITFLSPNPEENDTYCSTEDPIGLSLEDILPEEVATRFREKLDRARLTGQPQLVRYQQPVADTVRFFEALISPFINGDCDVTVQPLDGPSEPNQLPHTPTAQITNYEALISRLPGALYRVAVDYEWTVLYISAGIHEFLGYDAAELMSPTGLALLDIIYEPDRAHVRRLVEEATKQNARFTIEYRMVHADGTLRWVNEQGQVILDENQVPMYFEGIIMDITESFIKRESAALRSSHLASVGTLGAGVAHEINNALAIMMANLDYAIEELENVSEMAANDQRMSAPLDDINSSLSKLGQSMKRVQKIVHDLRSYSDAAGAESIETINLARLIDWALHEALELTQQPKIIRNFPDHPVLIVGNQLRLLQVFTHIFSNAEKSFASEVDPQNIIRISLRTMYEDSILIEIDDSGCGITAEVLPRIFEPFFSTRPFGEGTGLGLFVCQGIVHTMNGEILISSTPGKGTTVQIILPKNLTSY